MIKIPLSPLPNQEFMIVLGKHNCTINIYQRGSFLYLDLFVNNQLIQQGALIVPKASLVTVGSALFSGQLRIIDKERKPLDQEPPNYLGLGSRYELYYLSDQEVSEIGLKQF